MPLVRMRKATYSIENDGRLAAGQLVDVDDEVARRWRKNGLAGDSNDAQATAALGQSTDALQVEVDRLNAEIAAMRSGQVTGPHLPDSGPYTATDELARLDFLNEQQRVNLQRAGFGTLQAIRDATEDDLAEVDKIGAATLLRLRQAAEPGSAPSPTSNPQPLNRPGGAITHGPGPR